MMGRGSGPSLSNLVLTAAQVEAAVRLAHPEIAEIGSWSTTQLSQPIVTETAGVLRLDGVGWSLILKLIRAGSERELRAYASGLLPQGPSGLRTARVYGRTEVEGAIGLWLEVLPAQEATRSWALADFSVAARHLGQFGAQVALPGDLTWFERHEARSFGPAIDENVAWLRQAGGDARIRRIYTGAAQGFLFALDRNREQVLEALETTDRVCCHGDAQRRNLFRLGDSTVAIDWARFGTGPVGTDLVTLLRQGLTSFDLDISDLDRSAREISAAHLQGLSGAGWTAEVEWLQSSLAAQHLLATLIELRPNLRLVMLPDRRRWAEEYYGRPFDTIVDRRRQIVDWTIQTYGPNSPNA